MLAQRSAQRLVAAVIELLQVDPVKLGTEGTGEEAKFTFSSRPKPDAVPDAAALVAATASEPSSGTNPSVGPSSEGPGAAQALG